MEAAESVQQQVTCVRSGESQDDGSVRNRNGRQSGHGGRRGGGDCEDVQGAAASEWEGGTSAEGRV